MVHPYLWIVIVSGVVCFLVACGNGANDLANAFGTSYGSRVLTLLQIVLIAACCEFAGAVGLGSNVATTMSSGIASPATFQNDPFVLMYGFLCALGASFIWLLLATWKDLPVSTHHAIAGGIIGFALVYGGGRAVIWAGPKETFPYVSGVVPIIASWFISPLLAGIVAAILYGLCRLLILQRPNAAVFAPLTLPAVVLVTFYLEFLFIFMIAASGKMGWTVGHAAWMAAVVAGGAALLSVPLIPLLRRRIRAMEREAEQRAAELGIDALEVMRDMLAGGRAQLGGRGGANSGEGVEETSPMHEERTARVATTTTATTTPSVGVHPPQGPAVECLPDTPTTLRAVQRREKDLDGPREVDGAVVRDDDQELDEPYPGLDLDDGGRAANDMSGRPRRASASVSVSGSVEELPHDQARARGEAHGSGTPPGVHGGVDDDDEDGDRPRAASDRDMDVAGHVRHFDPRAECMFRYLQVFTAACTSLAHGSNDVSNATGPFAAIVDIYTHEEARAKAAVPVWLLCLGGAGIVVGLATYGVNIMRLLGEKVAFITPVRGFAAELATALVVAFATTYGIPISTTHCITGAIVAISMVDVGVRKVRWAIVLKMYAGWVMTLVITGILSACFFSQGIYAPIPGVHQ